VKKVVLFAALAAFSTPAMAGDIHISTEGKDVRTIKAEVLKASAKVCDELIDAYPWRDADREGCIDESYRNAMAQWKRRQAQTKLALERGSDPAAR
jgi:hypothetical protein